MARFSDELFNKICERIADGESVNSICSSDDMPSRPTFYDWIGSDIALANKYARATETRADTMFDDLLYIADTPMIGEKVKIDKDGNEEIQRADMIEHRRLQVDARKWSLARMAPRKYGDKVQNDHTSSDGSMTPRPAMNLSRLSDEELAEIERLTNKASDPAGMGKTD